MENVRDVLPRPLLLPVQELHYVGVKPQFYEHRNYCENQVGEVREPGKTLLAQKQFVDDEGKVVRRSQHQEVIAPG